MMTKPSESPVSRQHQSHPEETEEELREHQDGGGGAALPPGVTIKQEPPDPQELQEEALQRQAEQELLFRQVLGSLERSKVKTKSLNWVLGSCVKAKRLQRLNSGEGIRV